MLHVTYMRWREKWDTRRATEDNSSCTLAAVVGRKGTQNY